MIKYLKYDANTLLRLDESEMSSRKVDVSGLSDEIAALEKELAELTSVEKDDKKLLEWAKKNFPFLSRLPALRARLNDLQVLSSEKAKL
jgi:hypothetical protein